MKTIKYILFLVCVTVCFTACSKNDKFDQDAQFRSDTTDIRKFITDNKIPALKDKSGIFYQILAPGSGAVTYTASTSIKADYEGRLLTGFVFDGSKGTPISFTLGSVIAGWQIAIPYIQNGGKIRFILPSYYGYGNSGIGSIPANSILDFTVTLTDVR
jgi:FKBP-type peptidyl-prolyl cis-trans isomerase FkpA